MLEGGCACGAVRYAVSGTPFNATACHCADCRWVAAAPLVAWFTVRPEEFRLLRGQPRLFASSDRATRAFCADCGTPLTFRTHASPDEIDVTTCSLDQPERVPPRDHAWVGEGLPWVHLADGLPRYRTTRAEG